MERTQVWGGIECTVNRIGDAYMDQLTLTGHAERDTDLDLIATTGIRVLRYPVLWERIAPMGLARADWSWADARLSRMKALGIEPIVGLVHHGSGPAYTSLLDPAFPEMLAEFAGAVARRYPWVRRYTPVNEPLTTARFSGLYGHWYPHARSDEAFVRCLYHQCRATVCAMQAIRAVNPAAELVQTEDAALTYGPEELRHQTEFENRRRWLSLDLLHGRVDHDHPLWSYLLRSGLDPDELRAFRVDPCPPDIVGLNYYVTSDRMLDPRMHLYPPQYHGGNHRDRYADIEAVRAHQQGIHGHLRVLLSAWKRYRRPVALTEVHLGGPPEEQVIWLLEAWGACQRASQMGVDVRAMTVWSLLGCMDWDSLVTLPRGHYEAGVFDIRGKSPRPTALFRVVEQLTRTGAADPPRSQSTGWWRRDSRLIYTTSAPPALASARRQMTRECPRPLMITGQGGTLATAFAKVCEQRELPHRSISHREMDIADPSSVRAALERWRPWGVVNAAGFVRVDEAERQAEACERANTLGPATLAAACSAAGIGLLTFSSDLVFDGANSLPYVESSIPRPLSAYGRAKAAAELRVATLMPQALVVRSSAFFGPWDEHNFLSIVLRSLRSGARVAAADDLVVSPTYVPELVAVSLNLLIDGAFGLWHLANDGAITWADFARLGARMAGLDESLVDGAPANELGFTAPRPSNSALASERGRLMGSLERALGFYQAACAVAERAA